MKNSQIYAYLCGRKKITNPLIYNQEKFKVYIIRRSQDGDSCRCFHFFVHRYV